MEHIFGQKVFRLVAIFCVALCATAQGAEYKFFDGQLYDATRATNVWRRLELMNWKLGTNKTLVAHVAIRARLPQPKASDRDVSYLQSVGQLGGGRSFAAAPPRHTYVAGMTVCIRNMTAAEIGTPTTNGTIVVYAVPVAITEKKAPYSELYDYGRRATDDEVRAEFRRRGVSIVR